MIGRTQLSKVEEELEKHSENLADEREIRRVVDEIDNRCDLKDWAGCRSCFADEVEIDFTSLAGGEPSRVNADDLIAGWRTNLFEAKKSFHTRTNHSIKIDDDRAEVFSKGYAFNLIKEGEGAGFWEVWGHYTHRLEKTPSGWKCTGMKLDVIHQRGDEWVRTYS
ncbi:MAG: nuclear transport factor 2 family protein [Pyrinomonadaceae bacterium]